MCVQGATKLIVPWIGHVANGAVVGHQLFQQLDLAEALGACQCRHAGYCRGCLSPGFHIQLRKLVPVAGLGGVGHLARQASQVFVNRKDIVCVHKFTKACILRPDSRLSESFTAKLMKTLG